MNGIPVCLDPKTENAPTWRSPSPKNGERPYLAVPETKNGERPYLAVPEAYFRPLFWA